MASVFQTLTPSCVKQGTRMEGASSSNSLRAWASSAATICSVTGRPANRVSSQPRSDQDE